MKYPIDILADDKVCIVGNSEFTNLIITRLSVLCLLPKNHGGLGIYDSFATIFILDAGNITDVYQYVTLMKQGRLSIKKAMHRIMISRLSTVYLYRLKRNCFPNGDYVWQGTLTLSGVTQNRTWLVSMNNEIIYTIIGFFISNRYKGVGIIEGLDSNLKKFLGKRMFLVCLPLLLIGIDGSPLNLI
jgi:hypothetical protein